MKKFFSPKTVAVIGASNKEWKVGYALMYNLRYFKNVVPINLNESSILGRKCYRSVLEYKKKIDLAIISIPAKFVKKVLIECGKKKIKNVIIISAGFSEIGNIKEEEELLDVAKKYGVRILGANCFGTVNPYVELDTSFAKTIPDKGHIAFISQSGALWSGIVEWSLDKFGFSKFASLGNMVDVDFADLIGYLSKDKLTKVIVCYIEYLKNGKKFMDAVRICKKPVIVIKAGVSEAGIKAALSHTGSIAGKYEIYKAAFKQCGAILVENLTDAFNKANYLCSQRLGKKVVIVSNAGGPAVLASDYCNKYNLEVVRLPKNFIGSLRLPNTWSKQNPIDLVGDADYDRYREVFKKLNKKGFFDSVLVILTQQRMVDVIKVAEEVINFKKKSRKNVVCCFMGGNEVEIAKSILLREGIPCFFEIEDAVKVLGNL